MEPDRTTYLYRGFTITTLEDAGVWWAKARISAKDAGGDRPVRGGPWRTIEQAKTAAEAFCDTGKAG
jgi:hypothetical protein